MKILIYAFLIFKIDTVAIIFTSDILSQFGEGEATFINPNFPPPLGGALSFESFLKEERSKYKNLLLFDTGNLTGGYIALENPNIDEVVYFYKKMKYNAICPGVREFIGGVDKFKHYLDKGLIFISSNIVGIEGILKYKIFEENGIKIGVFGLTTQYMPLYSLPWNVASLKIIDEIETAKKMVKILKDKGVDIIICLSNIGYDREKILAREVEGIDVILGGFEGYGLREPYIDYYTHTILLRVYDNFSNVGEILLFYDTDSKVLTGFKYRSITLFSEQFPY